MVNGKKYMKEVIKEYKIYCLQQRISATLRVCAYTQTVMPNAKKTP